LNVVSKRKILFKATIDESHQRLEGGEIQNYWGWNKHIHRVRRAVVFLR